MHPFVFLKRCRIYSRNNPIAVTLGFIFPTVPRYIRLELYRSGLENKIKSRVCGVEAQLHFLPFPSTRKCQNFFFFFFPEPLEAEGFLLTERRRTGAAICIGIFQPPDLDLNQMKSRSKLQRCAVERSVDLRTWVSFSELMVSIFTAC